MRPPRSNEIVWGGGVLAFALLCAGFFATCTRPAQAGIATEDPCDASERRWGKRARGCPGETAGDRWSEDVLRRHEWLRDASLPARSDAEEILSQVSFPKPGLALVEIDNFGNIIVPTHADALVTHDGVGTPEIAGMDIRGSRCARSVEYAMRATDGPFTVVCLPREYGLYERMQGLPAPGPDEPVAPIED